MKCDEIFRRSATCWRRSAAFPSNFMMDKIVQALTTAYKRDHEGVENVIVDVDEAEARPEDVCAEGGRRGGREPRHTDVPRGRARSSPPSYEVGSIVNLPGR